MREVEKFGKKLSFIFGGASEEVNEMIDNFDKLKTDPFLRDVWWSPGMVFENRLKSYTDIQKPLEDLSDEEIVEKERTEAIIQKIDRIFENVERQMGK